jgi:hypothetical protein
MEDGCDTYWGERKCIENFGGETGGEVERQKLR